MDLVVHRFEVALPNISEESLQATPSKLPEKISCSRPSTSLCTLLNVGHRNMLLVPKGEVGVRRPMPARVIGAP